MSPTVSIVIDAIVASTQIERASLNQDTLLGALAIPSLDVLQMVFEIESKLNVTVPDSVATDLPTMTIGALATLLESLPPTKPAA
jgi:acyl carrier protein